MKTGDVVHMVYNKHVFFMPPFWNWKKSAADLQNLQYALQIWN